MEPSLNLPAILNLLGASQALILALALVSIKRDNRTANLVLAAFVATIALMIVWSVLISTRYIVSFPHLHRVNHPLDFVVAPLFYLHIRVLTSKKPELKKRDLLHFIPAGLCALYLMPYYLRSSEYKFNEPVGAYKNWFYQRAALAMLLALVYVVFIVRRVVRYRRETRDKRSLAERAALFQINVMATAFVAIWLMSFLRYLLELRYPDYGWYLDLMLPLTGTVFIYTLAYVGLRRPESLVGMDASSSTRKDEWTHIRKYEKSTLTPEWSEKYLKRLLEAMETEKPYLDGDLNLQKLADKLAIPAQHLSQIVNERLNQPFTDFINSYRVEEAKKRLLDPSKKHYSILAIAEEVGFNSKSSFNAVFKKHASMTPSEFRKSANGNGSPEN